MISDTVDLHIIVAQWLHLFLEPQFDAVVDNTAEILGSLHCPAMLGRTGRLVTDQSESDKIISPRKHVRFGWIAVVDNAGPVH